MKKQILSLAAGAALIFAAQNSFAQASFGVTATIVGPCTVTAAPTALGSHVSGPTARTLSNIDAGKVTVACPANTQYALLFNVGSYSVAADTRRMTDGAATPNFMVYSLETNPGGVVVGDKIPAGFTSTISYTPTMSIDGLLNVINAAGDPADHPLQADISIGANQAAGIYNDTVTVTLAL